MSPFDVIKTVRLTEKVMAVQERNDHMSEVAAKKRAKMLQDNPGSMSEAAKKKGDKAETKQQIHLVADPRATKNDIRDAVEVLWSVKVDRVNTMNVSGRLRRKRTRHEGRTARWKKAIVTLKAGDQITLT